MRMCASRMMTKAVSGSGQISENVIALTLPYSVPTCESSNRLTAQSQWFRDDTCSNLSQEQNNRRERKVALNSVCWSGAREHVPISITEI